MGGLKCPTRVKYTHRLPISIKKFGMQIGCVKKTAGDSWPSSPFALPSPCLGPKVCIAKLLANPYRGDSSAGVGSSALSSRQADALLCVNLCTSSQAVHKG